MFFQKTKKGTYRYYEKYFDPFEGKWRQVSCTMTSKTRQLQAEARKILEDRISKRLRHLGEKEALVQDLYASWLKVRKEELKASTYFSQKQVMAVFIREFGHLEVRQVTPMAIQDFLMRNDWSVAYKRLNRSCINLFMDYCLKMQVITQNPCENLVLPKRVKTLEEVRAKQARFYDRQEMRRFLRCLWTKGYSERMNLAAEFIYWTGVRFGELVAITKACINFDEAYLEITGTLNRRNEAKRLVRTSPKTIHAYRTIYLSNRCLEILKRLLALNDESDVKSDYVFVNERGQPIVLFTFNAYLKKFSQLAGVKPEVILTSHVLRHSHISMLVELGFPVKAIMERVGHGDEKVTTMIYTHVTQAMTQTMADQLRQLTFDED